jgi:hypothetical protein
MTQTRRAVSSVMAHSGPDTAVSRSPNRLTGLLLVVLAALALRVVFYSGYGPSDDGAYTDLAYELSRGRYPIGTYDGPPVFPLRIGLAELAQLTP